MNDQVIIAVANAIAANARALEALVSLLPAEVQQEVKVTPPKKAKQEQVEVAQPVVAAAPVAPQPVVEAPVPKAPEVVVEPAPVSAPVVESGVAKAPFTTPKGLTDYLMESYKSIPHKAKELEALVHSLGYRAVNEIKPESYDAIYAGVEALK